MNLICLRSTSVDYCRHVTLIGTLYHGVMSCCELSRHLTDQGKEEELKAQVGANVAKFSDWVKSDFQ